MDITLSILLKKPMPGITYGIQKGSGSKYETIQAQQTGGADMQFNITLQLKSDPGKVNQPRFTGPFAQGKPLGQFIYIDIGQFAGQTGVWGGRIKIPLTGIGWDMIAKLDAGTSILSTTIPATTEDGNPLFATVKNFEGWKVNARVGIDAL
ncbi:MAG TPA: DUF5990 family protein [Chitinophagaceae bacterium]|nr:DUF5990 family protein [Chitinophagaceae bacterium]